jgi:hypothetical protein
MANMRANKEGQKYKAIHIAHGLSSEAMACEAEPISFVAGSDTDAICSELFTQRTGAIQLGDMKTIAQRIDEACPAHPLLLQVKAGAGCTLS